MARPDVLLYKLRLSARGATRRCLALTVALMATAGMMLLLATQAMAQKQEPATHLATPTAKPQPDTEDEIIVRGRRSNEPDFQEQWEYHQKEFERLNELYGPIKDPNRRLDRLSDMPSVDQGKSVVRTPDTIGQGKPSVGGTEHDTVARF
jgi:hypothetical protein